MPSALPSPYLSNVVIPYAPNAPGDRSHAWDWPSTVETIPSGVTVATTTSQAQGTETITLGYVGLTRAEVQTLEAFVAARKGRAEGFWCPTFQHDFHAVDGPRYGVSGNLVVRDWGFYSNLFPLTIPFPQAFGGVLYPFRHIAAYRNGSWFLTSMNGNTFDPAVFDETGARLVGYNLEYGNVAGNTAVIDTNNPSDRAGLMVSRLLWCRFADDAMTTEWDHPRLANVTLRVQHLRLETPA